MHGPRSILALALIVVAGCAAVGCGSPGAGGTGDGGPVGPGPDGRPSADGGPLVGDGGECLPQVTCATRSAECGAIVDDCGVTRMCGGCADGQVCGGGGTPNVCGSDALDSASGCAGVYNPDQMLDLHLDLAPGDWAALKADTTNDVYFPAEFRCGGDPALPFAVGVRRKRSGGVDKPGLKVDFNVVTAGGDWLGLKKLSLENGISEGSDEGAELYDLLAEYLSWRFMVRSGLVSGRAAFARVHVNGTLVGVYVNVEQVDKRFLESRLGDDTGWLYKKSGSADDGYKTNEATPNPYEADLCFWDHNPCATPAALETYLPQHLDVDQMLRFGGVNALVANADAPLVKDNNYYFYDWAGPRLYFPWDLDTVMKNSPPLFDGPGASTYTDVLFTHWEDDYDVVLTALVEGPLAPAAIEAEIDRAVAVAGAALDADPYVLGDAAAEAGAALAAWWSARHAQVTSELAGHAP